MRTLQLSATQLPSPGSAKTDFFGKGVNTELAATKTRCKRRYVVQCRYGFTAVYQTPAMRVYPA